MNLEILIPSNDNRWIIKNNNLYYKKYESTLVLSYKNNIIYVIIDIKIYKQTIYLIKKLTQLNIKFYLEYITDSSLLGESYEEHVIKSYLYTYIQKEYYYGFKKIDFNLVSNLIDWVIDNRSIDIIKECYDSVYKLVNYNYYDYFSNKYIYDYSEEVRDSYSNIYRDINIELILK